MSQDVWGGCVCDRCWPVMLASVSMTPAGLGAKICVSQVSELPVSLPVTCT